MLVRNSFLLAVLLLSLAACSRPLSDTEQLQRSEDSLFFGYKMNMPRDSFYVHSWNLNRQGLVKQGPHNQNIQMKMDSILSHPATMLFYPDFYEDRIVRMRVRFRYDAWAPWNKHLFADSLVIDVARLMTQWHGEGFQYRTVTGPYGSPTLEFTKDYPSLRIDIGVIDDLDVAVNYTDKFVEQLLATQLRDGDEQ